MTLGLILVVVGGVLVGVAVVLARGPLGTIRRLDATEANLKRYDEWRGGRHRDVESGPTGADEMRSQMRTRLGGLIAMAVVGIATVIIGLVAR